MENLKALKEAIIAHLNLLTREELRIVYLLVRLLSRK